MADFSETHDHVGFLWIAKGPQEAPPIAAKMPSSDDFDYLDIPAFKAQLDRYLASAVRAADDPAMGADERQYATGYKHGLSKALGLLMGTSRRTVPVAEPLREEPHS